MTINPGESGESRAVYGSTGGAILVTGGSYTISGVHVPNEPNYSVNTHAGVATVISGRFVTVSNSRD